MRNTVLAMMFAASAVPAFAQSRSESFTQSGPTAPPPAETLELSGPRFGVTMLSDSLVQRLKLEQSIDVKPAISQFGWQFEKQFYQSNDGVTVLNEWVALVGGLDQGVVIPSLSWLVGLRTKEGAEFGVGPNVTPGIKDSEPMNVALVIAAGVTFRAGILNVPLNFAVVPTRNGTRVSVLTGFTMRR